MPTNTTKTIRMYTVPGIEEEVEEGRVLHLNIPMSFSNILLRGDAEGAFRRTCDTYGITVNWISKSNGIFRRYMTVDIDGKVEDIYKLFQWFETLKN